MNARFFRLAAALGLSLCFLVTLAACDAYKDSKHKDKAEKIKEQSAVPGYPKASYNLSKWIRRNSDDFWKFMKANSENAALKPYLSYEGILSGDAHPANFAPILVDQDNGQTVVKFLNIDFDDAGRGPFVMDFMRLAMITKATKDGVKMSGLIQAYVQGLKGEAFEPGAEVAKLLATSVDDFRTHQDDKMKKRVDGHKFKLKAGKIEAYHGPVTMELAQTLLPQFHILDLASRPKTTDEEEDEDHNEDIRVWILVHDDQQNRDRHFELKEWKAPALELYEEQKAPMDWLKDLQAVFWPGVKGSAYTLVTIPDMGLFWIREKEVNLVNVPYSSKKPNATEYVRQFSSYDAYLIGQAHGQQPGGQDLANMLSTKAQQKVFSKAIKNVMTPYMRAISDRVH